MERYRIVGLFFLLKKLNLNKKIKRIKKKIVVTWKIVEVSKGLVIYIYIYRLYIDFTLIKDFYIMVLTFIGGSSVIR